MNTNQSIIARRYSLLCLVVGMLFTLGIGNAGGSSYYTGFKATGGTTGKGYVYASTSNTATPVYETEVTAESKSSDLGENKTKVYYAWAKAVRGSEFAGWTITGSNNGVTPTSGTASPITVTVTSNVADGTNTGTATASWTTYTKVNVTYNPSEYGVYSVTYQYDSYNETTKEITTGDAENLSRTISSENGAQTIGSYKNDVITLKSISGTFQGWYSDAGFTSLLSTDNPYTYTAPTSGAAAVYPKYEHVDKYYGRLAASIAEVPYSMPGGGTIFVSKEEAGTGTYSADAQTIDNVGMGTASLKYYLHAQPTDKRYVFRGWYSNPECTGTALSTNTDYTYTFTATSMNSASPSTGNVYAAFDFNLYYMQVEVEPAVPGLGMVLVKDDNSTTPDYTDYSSHSEQFAYAYRLAPTATVYLYAKPKYGYKFSGWYDNPDCTGTAKSTANPYTYAATGTSTDPMNPTIIKLYAKFVEDATTVNITYNLPDQTKGEYTASVLDIAEVDDDFIWTFTQVFSSEGKTGNTTQAQHKTDVLRLEAQPKAGYGVTSWTIASAAKTTPSQLYETTGTAAATYGVTFGDAKPFLVCSTTSATTGTAYTTLREAIDNLGSNKKIVVVQNAYVPAGNYTIPSGVTLLVPFDEGQTLCTTKPGITKAAPSGQSSYCTLTLASGANIAVKGAISVSAHQNKGQPYGGAVTGKYGKIELKDGAKITLNSGSYLYCWGYITGAGQVDALNGSNVYEDFQIACWRGGTAASSMNGNSKKVFPLAQYYIQNIESKINFHYGSSETVYTGVTIKYVDPEGSAKIIGTSDCLFQLKSGAILSRWFDASKDRQMYLLNGDATLGYVEVSISVTVDSRDYILPLTNNMDITINSGSTFTCDYDFAVLPGASITINEGAKVSLGSNCRAYLYDKSEWPEKTTGFNYPGNVAFYKIAYTDTKITTARTYANMADAKFDVNGTLEVNKAIYTTAGGADICSSKGTGNIQFKAAAGTETVTYQATQSGSSISYTSIPITSAKLHNGDDSYTLTAGSVSGDKFIYSKPQEKWLKNPKVVSWNANGGTTDASTMAYSEGAFVGELPAAYKDGYTLEGWYTAADGGTKIDAATKVTANITYYAHWTPKTYHIAYMDQGKAAFSSTHIDTPNAHPTTHTYGTATTLNGVNDKADALFGGWHTISNCKAESRVTSLGATAVSKDITLYAKWIPLYTLTVEATPAGYGTVSQSSVANVPEGSAVTTSGNTLTVNGTTVTATPTTQTAQYTYAFDHWNNVSATVTAAATIQAVFTRTTRSYNVTFNMKDHGSAIDGQTKEYGSKVDKPSDPSEDGYTFVGWYKEDACTNAWNFATDVVTGETTLFAKWTANEYTITFDSKGGSTVESITQDYGTVVTAPANPTREGYTFNGWNPAVPSVMPANNVECVAQWTANTNTAYTVKHWQQNIENDEYTEMTADQESKQGTTATATAATAKTYTGFTAQTISQETIAGDGTTVVSVYYNRNTYTVTWNWNESGTPTTYTDNNVRYGATAAYTYATPTKPSDATYNYTFTGWSDGTNTYAVGAALPAVTAAITYTAQYAQVNLDLVVNNKYELPGTTAVTNVTVTTDGTLTIDGTKVLTATNLILQATTSSSGQIIADETNLNVINAYFDLTLNAQTRTWYGVGVPWRVNAQYGIYGGADKDHLTLLRLGKDFDIIWYDGATRAAAGPVNSCYKYLEDIGNPDNRIVEPGRMYFMFFARPYNVIRFKKTDDSPIVYSVDSYEPVYYEDNLGRGNDVYRFEGPTDETNWNWNGIANSYLRHVKTADIVKYAYRYKNVNIDEHKTGQWELLYDWENASESSFVNSTFVVGQPVMVQVPTSGSRIMWNVPAEPLASSAPLRRMTADGDIDRAAVQLVSSTGVTDRILCVVNDKAEDRYTIGDDLVKFATSDDVPQLWIRNYKHALAVNTIRLENSIATYPLTIVSPKAGDYTLSLANKMADGIHVYLTLNGEAIADLTEGEYVLTLGKETSKAYGIRLVRGPRGTVTAIDEALEGKENVEKVVKDGVLYIIRQGNVYDASGRKVE